MRNATVIIGCLAAATTLILVAGCGGSGASGSSALAAPTGTYQALQFTLTTDKQVYSPGQTVTATLSVTNTGSQTLSYTKVDSGEGLIAGRGNSEIWDSVLHGATTGGDIEPNQSIAPGQTITYGSITWNLTADNGSSVQPGTYGLAGYTTDEFYGTGDEPYNWFAQNFGATTTITVN